MASNSLGQAGPSSATGLNPHTAEQAKISGTIAAATADRLPRLAEILPLFQRIQLQGAEETIKPQIEGLNMAEKAVMVVEMLGQRAQQAEVISSLVDHLWHTHVVPHQLWEHYDGGKGKFMEDVDFTRFVQPTLNTVASIRSRKARAISTIQPVWGEGWERVIEPNNDHLSILSEKYLRHMAYLARNRIGLFQARELLYCVRDTRLSNPRQGVSTSTIVTVGDAQKVRDAVKSLSESRNISPSQLTRMELLSSLQVAAPRTVIARITELESPVATPISDPPTGLLAADICGITLQVPLQIHSLNKTGTKLVIFTISPSGL